MKKITIVFWMVVITWTGVFSDEYKIVSRVPVQPVWPGVPVGFALETVGERQFVCFYAADRTMTAAQRMLGSSEWTFQKLPSQIGWDAHNYIAMTVDDDGFIHISGNMHCDPLVYFRSEKPYDVTSLKPVRRMTGKQEQGVTYPKFIRGPNNELIFTYRDGSSGNGVRIYNKYDLKTRTWSRLLDTPLLDGQGIMNAYPSGPMKGPDGFFHLAWVWRDPGCASLNHDLSYARSRDLVHWETAGGEQLELPIRLGMSDVIVDPVPVKGGMINNNIKIGFDSRNRVIVSYHKFDAVGNTQIYNARFEDGNWNIIQTSDWNYRWDFSGRGCIQFEVGLSGVEVSDGILKQSARNSQDGSFAWELNEETLKPIGTFESRKTPAEIRRLRSDFPDMRVKTLSEKKDRYFLLRWESLPTNRDLERPKPWPEPSMLEVFELK